MREDEISRRRIDRDARHVKERRSKPCSFRANRSRLMFEERAFRQKHRHGRLRQRIDVIGWTNLLELGDPCRMRDRIAQSQARHSDLRKSPDDNEIREVEHA